MSRPCALACATTLSITFLFTASAAPFEPRNTQAPDENPLSPAESVAAITVPEGFKVTLFAGEPDVRQPVAMALDDRGRLWVAESYSYQEWEHRGEDRVLIFEDTDNDGRHDKRTVFYSGANHLSGMTVGWGGVWICDSPNLLFIPDRDRDDVPDGEPEVVLDGWTTEAGHNFFNGLTWGVDGWLYGRHGITTPSNVGLPGAPESERIEFDCSIWRYHPVDKKFEIVCRGTTNPWGLDWNAEGQMFFTNNVNGHLWHAIPGALYHRMGHRPDPVVEHVYDRIGMCADHLHHAGTTNDWTKTRDGKGVHGELGGGHSHCGAMIYLGGKWPEEYHGKIFMCNTHGRRVNVDRLERRGSGYKGLHEPDFLQANNPWFKGVELLYGPDGDVYLSDWTDLGECHDRDGVHRSSGRIYKIIYGKPSPPENRDLWNATDEALLDLQLADNEWLARTARHLLQQRAAAGKLEDRAQLRETLRRVFAVHPDRAIRIRILLTLHATRTLPATGLDDLIRDPDEHIRAWAIRLSAESPYTEEQDNPASIVVDTADPSALVRLHWASHLQNNEFDGVSWRVARGLAKNAADAGDPNIPLMIWYGIKDSVADDPGAAMQLLTESRLPALQSQIARRLAEIGELESLVTFLTKTDDSSVRLEVLGSIVEALRGRRDVAAPDGWDDLAADLAGHPELAPLAARLGFVLDRASSVRRLRHTLAAPGAGTGEKKLAIELLAEAGDTESVPALIALVDHPDLGAAAIRSLAAFKKPEIAEALIARYDSLSPANRPGAITALSANPVFAAHLLGALEAGAIPRHAVTAYHAREIQGFKKKDLNQRLAKAWGSLKSTSGEKKSLIKSYQDQLTQDVLAGADHANGQNQFRQLCSACHSLNGEGGAAGPDLTGANRADLFYLLENVIDPSATLPLDFRLSVLTMKDGALFSGNVTSENEYTLTLRTLAAEQTVDKSKIAKRETLNQSLMPEGLLTPLKPNDVRDLMAFLQRQSSVISSQ